jgi:hypothetical protein
MKKLLLMMALCPALIASAQETRELKKVLELVIPREGGARAASVAWHPVQKKYYAAMAGNSSFCLGVYDIKGSRLSLPSQETMFDVRGLWYNPGTKTLQMNGYNDFGWAEYALNTKGIPVDAKTFHSGMQQPNEQSVGAFDPKKKKIYFFNGDGNLDIYDSKDGSYGEQFELHLGAASEDDATSDNSDVYEDYNNTTVIFTGIKNAEFGLLNHTSRTIELYSAATGYKTKELSLPDDAPAEDMLCFSYSNGIYWLFDRDARIWKGYK